MNNSSKDKKWNAALSDLLLEERDVKKLRGSIFDECHFRVDFLREIGWEVMHADNGGELDSELQFICNYANLKCGGRIFYSSASGFTKAGSSISRGIKLIPADIDLMWEIQSGFWFFNQQPSSFEGGLSFSACNLEILNQIAFGRSVMFCLA